MNLRKARIFLSANNLLDSPAGHTLVKAEEMTRRANKLEWGLHIRHDFVMTEKRHHIARFRRFVALPEIYSQLLKQLETYGYTTRY